MEIQISVMRHLIYAVQHFVFPFQIATPIAYSIVDEVHWYHPSVNHSGVESEFRQVQLILHIIGGRELVKSIKNNCRKCRILEKNAVKVAMGPIQDINLCIAPAFYSSQVDLSGPFNAYPNVNKRAIIKIWFAVFCCCTTGAVGCKLMEEYSTDSFSSWPLLGFHLDLGTLKGFYLMREAN